MMATVLALSGTPAGNAFQEIMQADDIQIGSDPSYQLCKQLYLYHPLGAKMAEAPISIAQSDGRDISIPDSPEDECKEAFLTEWEEIGADDHIHNVSKTARIYGVASLALIVAEVPNDRAVDYEELYRSDISFNILDPLNTAGSLVLNQNPNALDFQKQEGITIAGSPLHRSRSVVLMNERPIYIGYTQSAFGYVGRSVYQRSLFPLKSFLQTMITDDLISLKAGIIIAKIETIGSIVNMAMQVLSSIKRAIVKEAQTGNVLQITPKEDIESIDLNNIAQAGEFARNNILKNIAVATPMPARWLDQETLVSGFGEGTEDAKKEAQYVEEVRKWMRPAYRFMDNIVMHRAWNPEFYKKIQRQFPEYRKVEYGDAFLRWKNSFAAGWPSLLKEPESEQIRVEETKFNMIISLLEVLLPICDPTNKAALISFAQDNLNTHKLLFPDPLELDAEAIANFEPPENTMQQPREPKAPRPRIGRGDSMPEIDTIAKAVLTKMKTGSINGVIAQ